MDFTSQQREKRRRVDDEGIDHMDMLVSSLLLYLIFVFFIELAAQE